MASSVAGRRLTETHRRAQVRIAASTVLRMRRLWPLLDPAKLTATTAAWLDASVLVIGQEHRTSAAIARRYFQALRTVEIGSSLPGVLPVPALNEDVVRAGLVINGPGRVERGLTRGDVIERVSDVASAEAAREASRFALLGSRDTLLASVRADQRALGYARAMSGNACAFCQLLASRGPVYDERSADFEAHRGCTCTAEPVWREDTAWPPGSREARDLYDEVAPGSDDPLNAFRRAVEAR